MSGYLPQQTSRIGNAVIRLVVTAAFVSSIYLRGDGAEDEWLAKEGFRFKELAVSKERKTGFTRLTSQQTGIAFTNTLTDLEGAANRVLLDGSGVALGDFDNDGRPDIFICGLTTRPAVSWSPMHAQSERRLSMNLERGQPCPRVFLTSPLCADKAVRAPATSVHGPDAFHDETAALP